LRACCCYKIPSVAGVSLVPDVAGRPAFDGFLGVVDVAAVAFIPTVADDPAVAFFPTVDEVLAVASFPADPGVPMLL
jgi:hypothetical protein